MSLDRFEIKITCRTCGDDFTIDSRFTRWRPNKCPVCYEQDSLDCHLDWMKKNPLEDFMRQRSEIRGQIESVTEQVHRLEDNIKQHRDKHPTVMVPWWRTWEGGIQDIGKKVALPDKVIDSMKPRLYGLKNELYGLVEKESQLKSYISRAKSTPAIKKKL
jgi:hypothetical protein